MSETTTIQITRTKEYQTTSRPGPAWKFIYDVLINGQDSGLAGFDLLSVARKRAKELSLKHGGASVSEAWVTK
jgi:hypothetical protein